MIEILLIFMIANGIDIFLKFLVGKLPLLYRTLIHLTWSLSFIYILYLKGILSFIYRNLYFSFILLIIYSAFGILIYVATLCIKNLVQNKLLILDIRFYFKRRLEIESMFTGVLFAILEEFTYRSWIIMSTQNVIGLLILSSIVFGLNHLSINADEFIYKGILGLVLGLSFICTKNLIIPIIVHTTYNIFSSSYFSVRQGDLE